MTSPRQIPITDGLLHELDEAERRAWDALDHIDELKVHNIVCWCGAGRPRRVDNLLAAFANQ